MNAHPLAQAIHSLGNRPDPRHRLIAVIIGDLELTAECSVNGAYRAAITQGDPLDCAPAEYPEVDVVRLWTADLARDLSGLMEDGYICDQVDQQVFDNVMTEEC